MSEHKNYRVGFLEKYGLDENPFQEYHTSHASDLMTPNQSQQERLKSTI